jgi:nitrogen fixation/metabolism regulation signal transduction histidine kinase
MAKPVRTRGPKISIIGVRGLIFIYLLLCILMVVFSRSFFLETFSEGRAPGRLTLIVFFTIPIVLIVFFIYSAFDLFSDLIASRTGSKFKARLLGYFFLIVLFSAVPGIMVTGLSLNEIFRYWKTFNTTEAMAASRSFAVDAYSLYMEKFEAVIEKTNFDTLYADPNRTLPPGISAVQEYTAQADGVWKERVFIGGDNLRFEEPPPTQQGFVPRTLPRDAGVIRYVARPSRNVLRVLSYNLEDDFDSNTASIEALGAKFETIDSIMANTRPLLIFYYGVFFFPTLVMTLIIAISFTRRVTYPIVELTEATRRVAEGDFSIQILAHRGDELGLLIRSFNAMVQDLEKSRAALLKSEKISIWQNMAQQLAHEIKNPLTPIKLSAERVLRRWHNEPEKIGEVLEDSILAIIQETEGLSTLLNEFKTLSRPMEPSQFCSNLNQTIEEILNPYRTSYPSVQFLTEHILPDITIKMDKHRLTQILTNLIINAIDAVNGGGRVEIRTDIVKKRDIRYCRLSIKDTGKGISKQDGPLVFTPYFTTKESGTGLGLPIVERIVNDHGGSIWYNSAEGMGTTFFVDLPVDNDPQPVDQIEVQDDGGE